jgi:hypothetical protein
MGRVRMHEQRTLGVAAPGTGGRGAEAKVVPLAISAVLLTRFAVYAALLRAALLGVRARAGDTVHVAVVGSARP